MSRTIGFGVFNYNCNDNAVKLAEEFRQLSPTYLIDSGSEFESSLQKNQFDKLLSNVFYCGMINEIIREMKDQCEVICFVASDVKVKEPKHLLQALKGAFEDPKVGIYAPSVNKEGSNHPQMRQKGTGGLRKAVFVDGFCFAARTSILKNLYPIDVELNRIGWGIDVYLSFLAIKTKMITVVDDGVEVEHYVGPNNHPNPQEFIHAAKTQRANWFNSLEKGAQRFRSVTSIALLKNQAGATFVNSLPW